MVQELKALKKKLPRGYTSKLAFEFNVSPATITFALQGKNKRYDIINRAIELANETNEIEKKLKKTLKLSSKDNTD